MARILKCKTATLPRDHSLLTDKLVSDVIHIHHLMKLSAFANLNIYVMDEMPVWLDMVSSTTVGAKDVPLETSGNEKVCFRLYYNEKRWHKAKTL